MGSKLVRGTAIFCALLLCLFLFAAQDSLSAPSSLSFVGLNETGWAVRVPILQRPLNACSSGVETGILVSSRPEEGGLRSAIRRMWGCRLAPGQRLTFVVGLSENATLNDTLAEAHAHGDLLVLQMEEGYSRLLLKTFNMLAFAADSCNETKWIVKVDADCLIEPVKLAAFLNSSSPAAIHGYVHRSAVVQRKGKNAVRMAVWPGERYPNYVAGPAYAMGTAVARALVLAAPFAPPLPNEDVLFTGIIAQMVKVNRKHHRQFYFNSIGSVDTKQLTPRVASEFVSFHSLADPKLYEAVFERVKRLREEAKTACWSLFWPFSDVLICY